MFWLKHVFHSLAMMGNYQNIQKRDFRYALKQKKRHYLGIFPKRWTPPPLLGTPYPKKNFSVYFAF